MNTKLFLLFPSLLLSGLLGIEPESSTKTPSLTSILGRGVALGLATYFVTKTAHSLFEDFDQYNSFSSSLQNAFIKHIKRKQLKSNLHNLLYAASAGAHICCLREKKEKGCLKATQIAWMTTTLIKTIKETEPKGLSTLLGWLMAAFAPSKVINKSFLLTSEQKVKEEEPGNESQKKSESISKKILSKIPFSQFVSFYSTPLFLLLWNSYHKKTLTIWNSSKKETFFQLAQFFQYGLLLDLVAGSSSLENTSKIFICNFLVSLQKENYDLSDFFKLLGVLEALSKGIKDN